MLLKGSWKHCYKCKERCQDESQYHMKQNQLQMWNLIPIKRYVFKKWTEYNKVYVWKILPLFFELGQCPLSKDEFAANTIILQNKFIISIQWFSITYEYKNQYHLKFQHNFAFWIASQKDKCFDKSMNKEYSFKYVISSFLL